MRYKEFMQNKKVVSIKRNNENKKRRFTFDKEKLAGLLILIIILLTFSFSKIESEQEIQKQDIKEQIIQDAKNKVIESMQDELEIETESEPKQELEPEVLENDIQDKIIIDNRKEEIQTDEIGIQTKTQLPDYGISLDRKAKEYLYEKCIENDFSYEYLLLIAYVESRHNPKAINYNKNGTVDKGLFQLNSVNKQWLEKELSRKLNLHNAYDNIDAVITYLNYSREYWSKYDLSEEKLFDMITLSYNKGIGGAKKYLNVEAGQCKVDYLVKVFEYKIKLEQM